VATALGWVHQQNYSESSLASTELGDHLLVYHHMYVINHSDQLSLLPSGGWEILLVEMWSSSVAALMVQMCWWQVKLCDPLLTHAIPECHRDEYHNKVIYKSMALVYFYFTLVTSTSKLNTLKIILL